MKVTLLLADAAQSVEGKLYILGGGWSVTGPQPTPSAIALKIDVPWDEANRPHTFELALVDADGRPFMIDSPMGRQEVVIGGEFEVGRPPGLRPGTPLDMTVAVTVGPLPLSPGTRYAWSLTIDGEGNEDWQVPFSTRSIAS